jgi:crotonobetainyl-CoA:carnitine CoA-transferase CaiB-like acyl-CoA transferase
LGNPDVLKGEEWYNGTFRNRNVDLIDAHVIEFTMNHTKMEIAELCQAKGVPCTPVNSSADFYQDPHIMQRGFFGQIEHPVMGRHSFPSPPYRINSTRVCVRRSAPLLGQHNREVYGMELGYTTDELAALKAEGTI